LVLEIHKPAQAADKDELHILCNHIGLGRKKSDFLCQESFEGIDWQFLQDLAFYHKVVPFFYHNLSSSLRRHYPADLLMEMKVFCLQNSARNLAHLSTLIAIQKLFEENGIMFLVFKGPPLAADVFGGISLRTFGDLDILVSRHNLRKSIHLLQDAGFNTDINLNIEQYEKLLATFHHAVMIKGSAVIELHWELSGRYFSKPVEFESVAERIEVVNVEGIDVPTLGQEDLLVYLCIHGCRHYWAQLDSVCCVNELVRNKQDLDWDLVLSLAQQQGAIKMLFMGLVLAQQLLGLELPGKILSELERFRRLDDVSRWVILRMSCRTRTTRAEPGYVQSVKYHYAILDRFGDTLRYILRPLLTPTHSDWLWVRVPAFMSPVYYLLRPVRLVLKYCRKVF
jgi:hypothetical protein